MKKWITCQQCEFFNDCKAGKNKTYNVDINSPINNELGCYGHKQYQQQIDGHQLKLF